MHNGADLQPTHFGMPSTHGFAGPAFGQVSSAGIQRSPSASGMASDYRSQSVAPTATWNTPDVGACVFHSCETISGSDVSCIGGNAERPFQTTYTPGSPSTPTPHVAMRGRVLFPNNRDTSLDNDLELTSQIKIAKRPRRDESESRPTQVVSSGRHLRKKSRLEAPVASPTQPPQPLVLSTPSPFLDSIRTPSCVANSLPARNSPLQIPESDAFPGLGQELQDWFADFGDPKDWPRLDEDSYAAEHYEGLTLALPPVLTLIDTPWCREHPPWDKLTRLASDPDAWKSWVKS
mgnify:CR=1 FL=1